MCVVALVLVVVVVTSAIVGSNPPSDGYYVVVGPDNYHGLFGDECRLLIRPEETSRPTEGQPISVTVQGMTT